MTHQALRERWDGGEAALGGLAHFGAGSIEPLVAAGYDWVWLDCQHGPYDEADAAATFRTLAGAPYALAVRVAQNDAAAIGRVLDAGADAVIVPLVDSPREAADAVAACRYPPAGRRSFGPGRPDLGIDLEALERRVSCFVMAESAAALEEIDAIAATPGLAGIVVGPIDLGISLGIAPRDVAGSARVRDALTEIAAACERAAVVAGILAYGADHAKQCVELGYRFVGVGADVLTLRVASAHEVALVREAGQTLP
ncbi:HpcH/HpaI aldolase/citrate lyase family protein [Conexibacter sp. CPCC 206217]|uniref:HpcH/HpaI aldolase family protein n=1 Tax=Conexibacter sp. CPCC 206217 TaxID=3064574 RepID=UPI00271F8F96|nr:aldolase/citrate lyase family protein [Conexibacter sp. CPCC 206217]MDO8211050.1 aldolase/citrate lyase family protein [Conexibacter sp. CPCC 206217]